MGFFSELGEDIDSFLRLDNKDYVRGVKFERIAAMLFNQEYFAIERWNPDMSDRRRGIRVEADSDPDFIIRYMPTSERFAVECKYRTWLNGEGKLNWAKSWDQLEHYKQYSWKNKIPVFIVIGLGGASSDPKEMFCIPLEEANYPELYPSIFLKFKRDPKARFFWKNGMLK